MESRTYAALVLLLLVGLIGRQAGVLTGSELALRGGTLCYILAGGLFAAGLWRRVVAPQATVGQVEQHHYLPEDEQEQEEEEERQEAGPRPQPQEKTLGDGEQYFW